MVFEHQDEYPTQWKAIESMSKKLKVNHETFAVGAQSRDRRRAAAGLTRDERARMKELEREVKELRRANEILKAAAGFFGAELDRQSPR